MARVIHEMCCYAHQLRDTSGAPLHRIFLRHPMLKSHRAPTTADRDKVHTFWLTDGRQGFHVMVCDGQDGSPPWLSIAPDGDFDGANVQSGAKARYTIRLDRSVSRPPGKLSARRLAEFVAKYEAVDVRF